MRHDPDPNVACLLCVKRACCVNARVNCGLLSADLRFGDPLWSANRHLAALAVLAERDDTYHAPYRGQNAVGSSATQCSQEFV